MRLVHQCWGPRRGCRLACAPRQLQLRVCICLSLGTGGLCPSFTLLCVQHGPGLPYYSLRRGLGELAALHALHGSVK